MTVEFLIAIPCLLVLVACACRIDQMKWPRSSAYWILFYVGAAFVAGDILVTAIDPGRRIDGHEWVEAAILCLYMLLTRHQWACGVPKFVERS